jgi:hypothetical protein
MNVAGGCSFGLRPGRRTPPRSRERDRAPVWKLSRFAGVCAEKLAYFSLPDPLGRATRVRAGLQSYQAQKSAGRQPPFCLEWLIITRQR